jgi:hypothetical protein
VPLGHVHDVETHSLSARYVTHAEEEPLVVSAGVDVVLQNQVVLRRFPLVGPEKVARLEVRAELHGTTSTRARRGCWREIWVVLPAALVLPAHLS